MISRCPSCGAPAPDEARQCRGCGWDFVANKKGEKKPAPPKKDEPGAEKPKPAAPAAQGLSLPPARGGSSEASASGLGMAKLPKVEPGGPAAPGAPDENPFALPVARNLGPKPGESLFAPPPAPPEPKLPEAKPKKDDETPPKLPEAKPKAAPEPEPEEPAEEEPDALLPPPPPPKKEPPRKEPPAKVEAPKKPEPAPVPEPEESGAEAEDEAPAALFLPSSTKEIVVEPEAKRAKHDAVEAEPVRKAPAETDGAAKPKAGRPSAVYLAALAGGVLGLFSVGAIYMMIRSEPPVAARPTGSSPFGKRAAGDSTMTPVLDDSAPSAPDASGSVPFQASPAPVAHGDVPAPTSLPAPVRSKAVEPPSPGRTDSPPPPPAPVAAPPKAAPPPRVTATFPPASRPAPAPAPVVKPRPAPPPAPKKPAGPQWVFEGVVYDLLTTRGAYGVRLVFVDAEDNEVASVETGEDGRYRAAMKPGPAEGYALRILHDDYSGKHIDELDSTSSVRKADLEQRKFLMQAGARSLPWIGITGKPVRRDMALVPRVAAE
jgi:hypothetical protein